VLHSKLKREAMELKFMQNVALSRPRIASVELTYFWKRLSGRLWLWVEVVFILSAENLRDLRGILFRLLVKLNAVSECRVGGIFPSDGL
jgi:hypothetical protein